MLPQRAKALIFAVIAHALDCEISAREARAMLPPEAAADDLEGTLAHLGGPGADALETLVAGFRPRHHLVYAAGRAAAGRGRSGMRCPSEQFVEAVGVASLANALCRLAAAVEGAA